MAQEHIDAIDKAIENVLDQRRIQVGQLAEGYVVGSHIPQMIESQKAIEALLRARTDEETRLPSVYETRGMTSV